MDSIDLLVLGYGFVGVRKLLGLRAKLQRVKYNGVCVFWILCCIFVLC